MKADQSYGRTPEYIVEHKDPYSVKKSHSQSNYNVLLESCEEMAHDCVKYSDEYLKRLWEFEGFLQVFYRCH
ncbi:MAG: hypothetical protein MHMPM18_004033 [Marteilia pararefringens]